MEKVRTVIKQMTLEEKAALVCGATFFGMASVKRLAIPRLQLLDGGTGINFEQLFGDYVSRERVESNSTNGMTGDSALVHVIDFFYEPERLDEEELPLYEWIRKRLMHQIEEEYAPGCFPPGILLGATFDEAVVRRVGQALGKEARLFGVDILLGSPNVNIHRDPLNGRLFEGYSEDPCLVSSLAPELVKGVQEFGVAANVKHFAANNQETNRVGIDEIISKRALMEIYLPGFCACVKEGKVKTVMSAYNRINGMACTENEWLLTELLRKDWGFEGIVVSDWGAVYHPVEALQAGNDLAMPGPISPEPIIQAVSEGRLKENVLDCSVERLLNLIDELNTERRTTNVDCLLDKAQLVEETRQAAYDAASEGIVLLKNKKNLFPLKKDARVLVLGSGAKELITCGSGSAGITTNRNSSFLDCLNKGLQGGCVDYLENDITMDAMTSANRQQAYQTVIRERLKKQQVQTVIVIYIATLLGMEGNDRMDMQLSMEDCWRLKALKAVKESEDFKTALVLNTCGPVELSGFEEDLDSLWCCFLPGMEGAHALADLMLGIKNPSGKLPITFPKRYIDTPTYLNFPGEGYQVHYGEGIYVGYRYYDTKEIEPAYSFGYGLSYTSFTICLEEAPEETFKDSLTVKVRIKNTGDCEGAEVVQLYLSDFYTTLPKPKKELKAFKKIWLAPKEEQIISLTLQKQDFASYDMDYSRWIAEEGYYDLIVATSSRREDCHFTCRVYLENDTPYSYGIHSTVKVLWEQEQLKEAVCNLFKTKGWDIQLVKSNYQYTPNRKLEEILPEIPKTGDEVWESFLKELQMVKKW